MGSRKERTKVFPNTIVKATEALGELQFFIEGDFGNDGT